MLDTAKKYYQLTKPGIIYGNILTAAAGFLLASKGHIKFGLFISLIIGVVLVIASACVFNNYIDRDVDRAMARTKKRALVEGTIPNKNALVYGVILGIFGFLVLALRTNAVVLVIGLVAFIDYVVLYAISKRRSIHGTLVGSISGAAPIVAGYCAITDSFNAIAVILMIILIAWQMAHFYSIAIYRNKDYSKAKIPVLPVIKGIGNAKVQIFVYVVIFIGASLSLSILGNTGFIYLIIVGITGLWWLRKSVKGFSVANSEDWAKKMFLFSLVVILVFSVMVSFANILP